MNRITKRIAQRTAVHLSHKLHGPLTDHLEKRRSSFAKWMTTIERDDQGRLMLDDVGAQRYIRDMEVFSNFGMLNDQDKDALNQVKKLREDRP